LAAFIHDQGPEIYEKFLLFTIDSQIDLCNCIDDEYIIVFSGKLLNTIIKKRDMNDKYYQKIIIFLIDKITHNSIIDKKYESVDYLTNSELLELCCFLNKLFKEEFHKNEEFFTELINIICNAINAISFYNNINSILSKNINI